MTSIRFSFCGGESVMPHYIWRSNLLLIISVEKENAISPSWLRRRGGVVFSVSRVYFLSFSFESAKASAHMQLLKVWHWCSFLKVKSDTILSLILAALKWLLEHHETLKHSAESHWKAVRWKWNSSRQGDTHFLHNGWKNRRLLVNH